RRVDADPALRGVGLVGADDAIGRAVAAFDVLDLDRRAEIDRIGVGGARVHHAQFLQALAEVAHAAVDLAELLLAVGVFGVLRAVALGGRSRERAHDFGPAHPPEVVELGLQARVAARSDQGGRFLGRRAPAGHRRLSACRRRGAGPRAALLPDSFLARDPAEDPAQDLPADLVAHGARGLLGHGLDHALA